MMKKIFQIPMLIIILVLLSLGCNKNDKFSPVSSSGENPEMKTQQKSVSILNMSDLEIIKKSADYLKSCGKSLVFEETKILYENSLKSSPICKDHDNEDVYYRGDYLVIYFYPHNNMQEQENILMVYIDQDGKVLGYTEEKIGQG